MDPSFIPIEIAPSKTPFGLDQLRRSYKTALSAEAAIAAAPAVGTADETFPFMFLMPINTPESAESATRVDLVYMGVMADDGEGNPVLPASKQDWGTAVQSASSSIPVTGSPASSPLTLQFYSQTSTLVWFTYNELGVTGTAPDPTGDPIIISLTCFDVNYGPTSNNANDVIANFFQVRGSSTIQSTEIVPGKYWQNTETITVYYGPPIIVIQVITDETGTWFVSIFATGRNYVASDSISISGASMTVTAVDALGCITQFSLDTASFTNETIVISNASGGTGTGARFATLFVPAA